MHRAFLLFGLLAACSSKAREADAHLLRLEGYADRMCACTDKACGDKVIVDLGAWSREMDAAKQEDRVKSEAEAERLKAAMTRYMSCVSKLFEPKR